MVRKLVVSSKNNTGQLSICSNLQLCGIIFRRLVAFSRLSFLVTHSILVLLEFRKLHCAPQAPFSLSSLQYLLLLAVFRPLFSKQHQINVRFLFKRC